MAAVLAGRPPARGQLSMGRAAPWARAWTLKQCWDGGDLKLEEAFMKSPLCLLLSLALLLTALAPARAQDPVAATVAARYTPGAQRLDSGQYGAEVRRAVLDNDEVAWSSAPYATMAEPLSSRPGCRRQSDGGAHPGTRQAAASGDRAQARRQRRCQEQDQGHPALCHGRLPSARLPVLRPRQRQGRATLPA